MDLDANFFGDAGAAAFIPFLTGAKHIKKFRITARGMTKAVGGQVGVVVWMLVTNTLAGTTTHH